MSIKKVMAFTSLSEKGLIEDISIEGDISMMSQATLRVCLKKS